MNKQLENGQQLKSEKQFIFNKKAKKVMIAILASMTGLSAVMVASAMIAYDSFVVRYERPNYAIYPGNYYYERVKDSLKRDEFYYQAGKSNLKGYYYSSTQEKGLLVVAHGFHAGADDYLPVIQFFVENGYDVFAYDCTGTYDSSGEDMVGMCQSLVDLDNTLKYLKKTEPYSNKPMFLFGHSWGGYAVASVLELHKDVRACACIAPMNNGYTIMQEKGEQYVGKLATITKPIFDAYQKLLFKDYVKYNGIRGINSCEVPVLVAQGIDDTIITYNGQSIMAYKDEITNPNVVYYEGLGLQGDHNNIWHSIQSCVYQSEVASGLKKLQMQKDRPLTDEEKIAYDAEVDHSLYSEINKPLFEQILTMFNEQL